jgi:hypothetical protein
MLHFRAILGDLIAGLLRCQIYFSVRREMNRDRFIYNRDFCGFQDSSMGYCIAYDFVHELVGEYGWQQFLPPNYLP